MNITVIGTGYVGLVTGTCFAQMGNSVTCIDINQKKIDNLKKGILPIYEPGLDSMVVNLFKDGFLKFSTSLPDAMKKSEIYFIAVGTPPGEDGSADLQYVLSVAEEIGTNLDKYSIIVNKSTVPVGTADKVKKAVQEKLEKRNLDIDFDVVSNPEFLKEGEAVNDFMKPDRIIIGTDSKKALKIMEKLYSPFSRSKDKIIEMGLRDAELTKYTANSMLATKISFINEIANLCEILGADVENVRKGIGSDQRIGNHFIYPGCGYGGSCFPKDVKALIKMAKINGVRPLLLEAVEERNSIQKHILAKKIFKTFGENLNDLKIGIWGLSFKPGTDDMREASSVVLINELISKGAKIHAYDPVAMDEAKNIFSKKLFDEGKIILASHQYEVCEQADALVLVTEWKPFRQPDFHALKKMMKKPVIFDGRNLYDPYELKELEFDYQGIGR
ncbi:MAG: UDP-glucose 6-dehydrogenase [Deltaproteobacteria bacterium]|nr:MAG: UDP-glucose 6-dehydrogenase [Deltaproteobacteria bacterium]PIE74953.1 MAG: UDP-glucose 6-dehydrogenase [Deltaproteobacteria bacterium]